MSVTETVVQIAKDSGFDLVGITTNAEFSDSKEHALSRLSNGHMNGLNWYTEQRVLRGTNPLVLMPDVQSIISVGINYYQDDKDQSDAYIARYAQGRDYHRVMKKMIRDYVRLLEQTMDSSIMAKWYVDDGPMLDKAVAYRSGLGWFGKNSNVLTKSHGSWVLLGEILTDLQLEPNIPVKTNCGECTLCIEMCPTGAIVEPYTIDNSLCISYHTIENRGSIPINLRSSFGNWVFGCDICQEVCPVNKFATHTSTKDFDQSKTTSSIENLLEMSEEEFKTHFAGTPVMRAKYAGMQRNACIAAGNNINSIHIRGLTNCLNSPDSMIRGHAAWALGQFETTESINILKSALSIESNDTVIEEIELALLNNC